MVSPTREEIAVFETESNSLREKHTRGRLALARGVKLIQKLQVQVVALEWTAQILYWGLYSDEAARSDARDSREILTALRMHRVGLENLIDRVPQLLLHLNRLAAKVEKLDEKFQAARLSIESEADPFGPDRQLEWKGLQWDLKWLNSDLAANEQIDQLEKEAGREQRRLADTESELTTIRAAALEKSQIAHDGADDMLARLEQLIDDVEGSDDDSPSGAPDSEHRANFDSAKA